MKNFTSVLRSHSGAVQARIPSLRSVTKQKSTPPFCKVCRWLMVLLVLTISMPVLAEVTLTSNNCQYEIQGTEGSRYLKIVFIKANGEVRVPDRMAVPIDDKKVSLSVKEVVAESGDYKVTKYIFEPNIEKVEIVGRYNPSVKSVIFEGDNTQVAFAFHNGDPLEEIRLPANITQFGITTWHGASSFSNCKTLKSVILPEKLEEIRTSLFEGCSALTTLVIPNTVTKIGKNAFKESGLTQITLPESLTTIEASAFYKTKLETITIPKNVTKIPTDCFYQCENLIRAMFPNTLTTIDARAFRGCSNLANIDIPTSLETIGIGAFGDCKNLKLTNQFRFPDSMKELGEAAFENCTQLGINQLIFPGNMENVNIGGFKNCDVTHVIVEEGAKKVTLTSNKYLKSITLPKTVSELVGFLDAKELENFVIDEDAPLTEIGDYTFYKCTKLKSFTCPKSVTKIGGMAFSECSALETVKLPEGITSIGDRAFEYCSSLVNLNIPKGVKTIGTRAFLRCSSWRGEVDLPQITVLPQQVFYDCRNLKRLTFATGITSIGEEALAQCGGLGALTFDEGLTSIGQKAFDWSSITELHLPESLKSLSYWMCHDCENLQKVTLPNSLTEIAEGAFKSCKQLTEINIPTALTTIRETAFDGCAMPKELNLSNVTTIEGYAFRNCTQLTKVILAKTLESIPVWAFGSCTSLADVTWPQNLKTISYYAFYEAPIATLQLPETVTSIGDKAFSNNKAITRFVFPKHVGKVLSTFSGCTNLTEVVLPEDATEIYKEAFMGTGIKQIIIPEGYTTIMEEAFKSCQQLETIVLPSTLTTFKGGYHFQNSPNIKHVLCLSKNAPIANLSDYRWDEFFDTQVYNTAQLYTPQDASYDYNIWQYFKSRKQAAGIVNLQAPVFSAEGNTFSEAFQLTIANPNSTGTLYYKVVPAGTEASEVAYAPYTEPIQIESSCRVWAYIQNGLYASEYAGMTYTYEPPVVKKVVLYVCGRLVDEKNAYDIFGDKTVSYDPKSEVLTLTWANIDATKFKASNIISGSGGDLTIRVVGHCTLKAPGTPIMYGHQLGVPGGSNLTIVGDENSILTVETTNEEKSGYSCGIDMYCGNLTIDNCTVVATGGTHGLYTKTGPEEGLTLRGEHALLNLTGTESAMEHVQWLDLDKMLMILEPEGAEFWDGSIWLGKEKQTHVVIGAPRTDDNVEVPEIREEYQTNFSSDLTDQKTGEALNVENVVINNVYYNLPAANNDGFDAKEQCLILNTSMDYYTMNKRIPADATVTADFGSWYNGLIIVVNGKGTIDIDYQTEGGSQLAVKIGEEEAKYYAADMQGRVQVPYDVATPQYVYIYNSQYTGDEKKAPARARAMAGKSWLKIYGMKITPQEPTGIHNIFVDSEGRPVTVYDMNGRKVNNPGKGVYIVNGKKIMKRQ
nr:leucine-rich repeat domain-containing protein [Prevotella sp.]